MTTQKQYLSCLDELSLRSNLESKGAIKRDSSNLTPSMGTGTLHNGMGDFPACHVRPKGIYTHEISMIYIYPYIYI